MSHAIDAVEIPIFPLGTVLFPGGVLPLKLFEARYLDGLIGPLPEAEAVYLDRSPLTHPERFRVPLLILQGAEDRVVPPSQAEAIRDALAAHGVAHSYVLYEGEGHGFRRAETVVDSLQRELGFLGAVFGFDTPGIPPFTLD